MSEEQKDILFIWGVALVLGISGLAFLSAVYGWRLALGLFVVLWASNMERDATRRWAADARKRLRGRVGRVMQNRGADL